jgi:hypothetical protein
MDSHVVHHDNFFMFKKSSDDQHFDKNISNVEVMPFSLSDLVLYWVGLGVICIYASKTIVGLVKVLYDWDGVDVPS